MAFPLTQLVFEHSRATLGARLVLLAIADQADLATRSARLSVAELGHRAGLSRRQTITAVRRLEILGEITVTPGRHGSGPPAFNTQTITLAPGDAFAIPDDPAAEASRRRRALRGQGIQRVIFDRDEWTCQEKLDGGCTGHKYLTIGHKIPIEDGGSDDLDNLQTECMHCNKAKGAR